MTEFMDQDFPLSNSVAKTLYHGTAEQLPMIDCHCHITSPGNRGGSEV